MKDNTICPICCQVILDTDSKQMVGLDRPYWNIWFHKACFLSINYSNDLLGILQSTVDLWYNKDVSKVITKKDKIVRKNK